MLDLFPIFAVGLLGLTLSALLVVRGEWPLIACLVGHILSGALVALALLPIETPLLGGVVNGAALAQLILAATVGALLLANQFVARRAASEEARGLPWWQWPAEERRKRRASPAADAAAPWSAPAPTLRDSGASLGVALLVAAIAGVAAAALVRLYPLTGQVLADLSFYWPALGAVTLLVLARDTLRLAAGVLVALHAGILLLNSLAGGFDLGGAGSLAVALLLVAATAGFLVVQAGRQAQRILPATPAAEDSE